MDKPHERIYKCFYKWNRYLLISVGHDIFMEPFKLNWLSYSLYGLFVAFYISCFYTIANSELLFFLNAITYLCIANEMLIKIYSVRYSKQIAGMVDFITNVYKQNEPSIRWKRYLIFENFAKYTEIIFKLGLTLYSLSPLLYFFYPFFMYVTEHRIVTLLPLSFPFVDEHTKMGYAILAAFHLLLMIFGLLATSASDFIFIMIITNVPVLTKAFADSLNDLNHELLTNQNSLMVRYKFRNIILLHKEIHELIGTLDQTFFKICFVQVSSGILASALLLFICLTSLFYPAYGLLIAFFFQIISFCALGTVIELANDGIYDSITTCNWYLLPLKEQEMFGFLLYHIQSSKALSVGGLAPLNMNTCVAIFKLIYSYVMLLYTFVA